ncbi:hypothetical protein FB451DRAFT_1448183 [Mycena latifolia]|nr:hypothetical protein FB451DRAFT_1448183 [Mycena latifolia]
MTQLNLTSYGDSGLAILYRHTVMEALHDSGERSPEPACHPGTRIAVLDRLKSWSLDARPENPLLWLHGSAGAGKSAIAQMFAGHCQSQRRLGASFFFKRGHPKRGTWHGLVPTIAYQLAKSVPEFLLPLQKAVDSDHMIVGRCITVQFQRLIVEPMRETPPLSSLLSIIILDGLDECADRKVQQDILRLFIQAVQTHQLPIRLVITSRPEPHIREIFETKENLPNCRHLVLVPDQSAYDDIRAYLRDEFARIHGKYTARGIELGSVWPPVEALEHLVQKSSGIFIYATTIIRFIDKEFSHPVDRLMAVLGLDPQSTAPLDNLYTQILSVVPQETQILLRVLM